MSRVVQPSQEEGPDFSSLTQSITHDKLTISSGSSRGMKSTLDQKKQLTGDRLTELTL